MCSRRAVYEAVLIVIQLPIAKRMCDVASSINTLSTSRTIQACRDTRVREAASASEG